MKKLKIIITVEESIFFTPKLIKKILEEKNDNYEIIKVFLIEKVDKKQDIVYYLISNISKLKISEIFKFFILFVTFKIKRFFNFKKKTFSVKDILSEKNINFIKIKYNINKYKDLLEKLQPDIILNTGSLYFNKETLKIPKMGCINRHSSILPNCGGFFPIFFGISKNEPIGTSIHFMNEKIDKGQVIIQKKIDLDKIFPKTLFKIYEKSFDDSFLLIIEALEIISKNKNYKTYQNVKKSYYSFPKKNDWIEFRKKKILWI